MFFNESKIEEFLRDFTLKLNQKGKYGIFGIAIEDCFNLGEKEEFARRPELFDYLNKKTPEIDKTLKSSFDNTLAARTRILGVYSTSSFFTNIIDSTFGFRFVRNSNSFICFRSDRKEIKDSHYREAFEILQCFNPSPSWLTFEKGSLSIVNDT
jgi:hypothetical protein